MSARLALLVSLAAIVYTAGNLVDRVRTHETDFSVFHRTAVAVTSGAGGELYGSRDPATGWFRALPPAGVALFVPVAPLDPVRASALWALANLGLLGVAVVLVRRIRDGLAEEEGEEPFHLGWAVVLLLVLAGGSLQVGQLSILFVTCWLLFLAVATSGQDLIAGAALAVPAVVKLYPLLLFAVPAALRRRRTVLLGALAALLLSVGVPAALYGSRWWPLTESFVRNELLDARGRAFESFVAPSLNSQGIDDVLFRHLSRALPSGRGSAEPQPLVLALGLAHAFRAFVLAVTAVAARRGSTPGPRGPRRAAFLTMALWCAALYLVLPGVKARYAIYCYPALLSLLAAAAAAHTRGEAGRARALTAIVVLVVALILQAMPPGLRATGLGLAGSVLLWVAVLREGVVLSPR